MGDYYRLEEVAGCKECGHGKEYEIAYTKGTEEMCMAVTYGDREEAEYVCGILNDAYEAGAQQEGAADASALRDAAEWVLDRLANAYESRDRSSTPRSTRVTIHPTCCKEAIDRLTAALGLDPQVR